MTKQRYGYRTRVRDDKCEWKANDDSVYASETMRGVTERDGRRMGVAGSEERGRGSAVVVVRRGRVAFNRRGSRGVGVNEICGAPGVCVVGAQAADEVGGNGWMTEGRAFMH